MRVGIGSITARCEACGGVDFQPAASPSLELACFSCGARTTRRALLMQVADETVRRAQDFLESSRRQRHRPGR